MRHKVGLLRDKDISTKKFRELTGELGRLLAYEATADFPLETTTIACWSGPTAIEQIAGKKVTVVPILRAGLGMLDGVLDMIPNARVSVVGLSRNHETLQPEHYFERFVGHLSERTALIVDPMLATAGSMIATVDLLKQRGCKDIRALVLVAAPRASGRWMRPTPTCAAGRRRWTATSTRWVTSFPAWATPATRSSAPSRPLRRALAASGPATGLSRAPRAQPACAVRPRR